MNKTFVRGVALLLIPTMLSSSGGAYGLADLTAPAVVLNISIPSHYGTITQSFAAPTRNPSPTVVLIQDLHGNLGVQRHIADILKYLAHRLSPSLTAASNMTVLVEGASGPFDETIFRSLKSRWVQKEVINRLIAERKLTGAEVAAIESDRPFHLWGIDDKALYLKNLQAFYRASLKSPVPTPKNPVWKNYYAIAHERDIPLALNALSHLDLLKRTANPPAIVGLVTGGYHTKGLTGMLKANGISYVVVTPAVNSLGEERAYTTLMQELANESRVQNLVALLRTVADSKHSFIPEATTEFQAEVPPTISNAAARKPIWARVWEFIINPIPVIQNWMTRDRERLRTPNRKLPPGEGLKDKPRTTQPTNIKPRPTKPSPARRALTWINQHLRWVEIPVLVPALTGDGFSNSGNRIRIPVGIMFRTGGEEMGGGPVGPGSAGGPAVIEPGILTRVGGLFGNKTIGDVVLNVEQVIADITRTVRPMIAPVLAARRAFLNSPLKAREKYAFPWTQKFKDADGNERTFHEIVQGLIDNFQGNKTDLAWRLNEEVPIPDDADPLLNPGLEITGPKALDMLINQINGAPLISSMMPDDEDASLAWQKLAAALDQIPAAFQGMANLKAILAGEYDHKPYVTTKKGQKREYTIKTLRGQRPAVFSRAPGIHLQSPHVLVDGAPAPQIVLSYVIHALNNHGSLTKDGSGVYYYQPKVQTPEEALVIETLIRGIETLAGLKLGSIKIKALYEEGRAGLTLPAIMWVWRHRLIGTNVGRWDYLGSLLEMWKDEVVFPDPQSIGMTDSRLMTYQRVNVLWNLMTGGVPIGGMAAVMPYPPNDPYGRARWNLKAYRQMKLDKLRERLIGLVFVPNEPLADGRQPSLVEALELKRQGKGRFYDMYRQSWVATPDEKYVAAGAIPLRAAINELQAMIDAPVEMVTIEGTNQKVPTVASGLTDGEKQAWQKLGLLNAEGQIKPWLLRKDKMKTPEELFSAEFWGGKDLWSSLYEPPAMNKPGEDDPAKGHITIERIQNAFFQAAQYGFQILNGNYAAAIDDYEAFPGDTATGFRRFMNDLATYRIYTVFLWTVFQHPAQITKDGWLKAPKLTENGVIPGENAVFLKAGEKMTPEIFAQLWDLHNQWTAAFFADFDRLAAKRLVDKFYFKVLGHEDLRILAVQKVLSKAYAKGPFKEISLDETTHQVAAALGLRNYDVEKMKQAIASEAPSFDRSQAPVIMDVLKRQFMSSDFLQHSPRVLFVLAETPEAKRAEIMEAIFSPSRHAVKAKVDAKEWSPESLQAYDYVHDTSENESANPTQSGVIRVSDSQEEVTFNPSEQREGWFMYHTKDKLTGLSQFIAESLPTQIPLAGSVEPGPGPIITEEDSKVDNHKSVDVQVLVPGEWTTSQRDKGLAALASRGATSEEAKVYFAEHYPAIAQKHLLDENGAFRQDLLIFVNNQNVTNTSVPLKLGDVIRFTHAIDETTPINPGSAGSGSFSGSPDSAIRHALSEAQLAVDQGKFDKAENMLGALYSGLEGSINRRGSITAEQYLTRFTSRVESITGYAGNADFPVQDVPHALNVIVDLIKKLPDGVNLLRTLGIASEALGLLSVARGSRGSVTTPTVFVTMSIELAAFTSSQPRIELHGSNEAELREYLAHHYYELDRHLRSNIVFRQANGSAIASGQIFSGGEEIKIVDTADRIPSPFAKPAQIKSKPPLGIPRLFRKIITVVIMFLTLDAFIPQFKETPEDIAKNPSRIEMAYKGLFNWTHTNWLRPRNLDDVQNVSVRNWIQQMQVFTGAENLRFVDELDDEALIDEAVKAGELVRTADGGFYARSHPDDTARSVSRTSVATHDSNDRGKDNYSNWQDSNEKKEVVEAKIRNSMRGKTMYVIPYLLGPVGSPYSQVGFQVTDSRYVAISMIRMAKVGQVAWSALGKSNTFVKGVHSTGDLDAIHKPIKEAQQNEIKVDQTIDKRDFVAFADEGLILSYGSAYGGNALLTKKFHALRLASYAARKQGWLAEHMLILGVEGLQTGDVRYVTAAFPSQSGKSNTAMMLPPDILGKRYRVWTVGDDIAWMFIGRDGQLHAFNSENGIFGVAPDTNNQTNPNAMKSIDYGTRTIYTNVAFNPVTQEVWWEGKEKTPDGKIIYPSLEGDGRFWEDWKGNKIFNRPVEDRFNEDKPWAETNSRYTTAMKNVPSWAGHSKNPRIQMDMAHPAGVPISAILWGGRMDNREPLIRQLRNFYDGIYDGLMLGVHPSKKTASAIEGAQKAINEDPMAMRWFFSYGVAEYAKHWVDVMERLDSPMNKVRRAYISVISGRKAVIPSFFHVNWFRKGADGKIIWPGYGENLRALVWALTRSKGEAGGRESFAGITPTPSDLNVEGLNLTPEQLDEVLNIDIREWVKDDEVGRRTQYINKVIGPLHIELQNSHEEFITGYEFAQVEQRPFSTLNATPVPGKAVSSAAIEHHENAHAKIANWFSLPVKQVNTQGEQPATILDESHPLEQQRNQVLKSGIGGINHRWPLIQYIVGRSIATLAGPIASLFGALRAIYTAIGISLVTGIALDLSEAAAHWALAQGGFRSVIAEDGRLTDWGNIRGDLIALHRLFGFGSATFSSITSSPVLSATPTPKIRASNRKKSIVKKLAAGVLAVVSVVSAHTGSQKVEMTPQMKIEAAKLQAEWDHNPMWEHTRRDYKAEDVILLRNSPEAREEATWAKNTSLKLRKWIQEAKKNKESLDYFGVMSGQEAVDAVRAAHAAGRKAVLYLSGWNTAASGNNNNMPFPDNAFWDPGTLVDKIRDIVNALKAAEQLDRLAGRHNIDWVAPIVVDIETGRGGALETYILAHRVIVAGAAAVHIENQDVKKCGHHSLMTLVATIAQKMRLQGARLASDVLDVPTVIIDRWDTLRAALIRTDIDPIDQPFLAKHNLKVGDKLNGERIQAKAKRLWTKSKGYLTFDNVIAGDSLNGVTIKTDIMGKDKETKATIYGPRYLSKSQLLFSRETKKDKKEREGSLLMQDGTLRTDDGFFYFDGGMEATLTQAGSLAEYADEWWVETGSPDLDEAKEIAAGMKKSAPWKSGKYNKSGNFAYVNYSNAYLMRFDREMPKYGFTLGFNTIANYWLRRDSMLRFARRWYQGPSIALKELQMSAQRHARAVGTQVLPNNDVGTPIYTLIGQLVGSKVTASDVHGLSTTAQFLGQKSAGIRAAKTHSLWSRASAILRLALFPGLATHEQQHIQDAIRMGLIKSEDMTLGARLRAYFTGETPVQIEGPDAWNAQRANLLSSVLWSLPVFATLAVNHWGAHIPLLLVFLPAWFALSNFIVGITEHLPKLGFFANYEESDARRAGLMALESDGVVGAKGFGFLTRQAIEKLTTTVVNPVLSSPVLKYGLLGVTTALVIIALSHLSPIKAATTVLAGVVMIPPGLFTRIVAAVVGIVNKPAAARIRDVGPVRVLTDA